MHITSSQLTVPNMLFRQPKFTGDTPLPFWGGLRLTPDKPSNQRERSETPTEPVDDFFNDAFISRTSTPGTHSQTEFIPIFQQIPPYASDSGPRNPFVFSRNSSILNW